MKTIVFLILIFSTACSYALFPGAIAFEDYQFLGGTTGAKKVTIENHGAFVLKTGQNIMAFTQAGKPKNPRDHILGEYYTNKVYEVLGIKVPECCLYYETDEVSLLSVFLEGVSLDSFLMDDMVTASQKESVIHQLKKGFVADCLLGNYDVIGLEKDNILIVYDDELDRYIPFRIDNGSGLEFEAQGALKDPEFWGPIVTELDNMRNPNFSYHLAIRNAGEIFQGITDDEIGEQINAILLNQEEILKVLPEKYHQIILERLSYLDRNSHNI